MNRQTIINIIPLPYTENTIPECWGNLKKACEAKGWVYNTLSKKKLPIEHDNCHIHRVRFQ